MRDTVLVVVAAAGLIGLLGWLLYLMGDEQLREAKWWAFFGTRDRTGPFACCLHCCHSEAITQHRVGCGACGQGAPV